MTEIVKDKIAFEGDEGAYHFTGTYLTSPRGQALVEITKDGVEVKTFLWPAYKIWNIAAHISDIVADVKHGLLVAGSDGLGGGVVAQDLTPDSDPESPRSQP